MTSLMRWDPFRDLLSLERDLGRAYGDFSVPTLMRTNIEPAIRMPSLDVINRGEDMIVRAEMPGITPENIDISIADGVLTLKGERLEESETSEADYLVHETSRASFERTMRLPEGVEPSSIHAEYRDGMLEITLPGAAHRPEPTAVHVPVTQHEPTKIESHH